MTGTHEISFRPGDLQRREMRRLFAISAVVHLALIASFAISRGSKVYVPRGVVAVELVSLPAPARPAAPAPAAKPAPPKPKPKPKPKKVVLPAEPTTPKIEPKAVEKPPPAPPKPKPEPKQYEDALAELREEVDDDALARLRAEVGEEAPPVEVAKAEPAALGTPGSPNGRPISPEVAAWLKRAKIHVQENWKLTAGFRTQALEAHVEVELDASGRVLGKPRLTQPSGNPWYDEGVIRAIQKSSPLPPPPEAGKWPFIFKPEDTY